MIRFIIERCIKLPDSECSHKSLITIDANMPGLEYALGGGYGEAGHEHNKLIGAEIISPEIMDPKNV